MTGRAEDEGLKRWTSSAVVQVRFGGILFCFWALWLLGQIVRDAHPVTALLFYIPTPCVAAAFVVLAAGAAVVRCRRLAGLLAILSLAPLWLTLAVENHWACPPSREVNSRPLRLVHWNVSSGYYGWDAVHAILLAQKADAYLLSEAPMFYHVQRMTGELGPGHEALRIDNMALVARGHLVVGEWLVRTRALKVCQVYWTCDGTTVVLLAVDIASSIRQPRSPLLRQVSALMVDRRPDIVMGDFNAPRRSRAISPPPAGYAHAYDEAGCGWSYTWPTQLPLLAIDQCLLGPRIEPLRYQLLASRLSDHRLQVLDFAVDETGE